jgi:hypothetical protein
MSGSGGITVPVKALYFYRRGRGGTQRRSNLDLGLIKKALLFLEKAGKS